MMPKLLGETTRRTRPELVEHVRALILSNSERAVAGAISVLMTRPDSTPLLSSHSLSDADTRRRRGHVDRRSISQEMHRAIAGSELVVIPQAGHLSSLEQPDAFNVRPRADFSRIAYRFRMHCGMSVARRTVLHRDGGFG